MPNTQLNLEETYSEAEIVARMNAALGKALHTPAKPHAGSKVKRVESHEK